MNLPNWVFSNEVTIGLAALVILQLILYPLLISVFSKRALRQQKTVLTQQWQDDKISLLNEHALLEQSLKQDLAHSVLSNDKANEEINHLQSKVLSCQQQQNSLLEQLGLLRQKSQQLSELKQSHHSLEAKYEKLHSQLKDVESAQLAQLAAFEQERLGFKEKLELLKKAEEELKRQFENVANKIFEQKAENFAKTSEQGLQVLLGPLKTQIDEFKQQITQQYVKEGQERAVLKSEIISLKTLNQQITQEASALTNALKGDNKQQGNWGEVVLSRVLAESGLREGHEYEIQKHLHDKDGKSFRPDVVVHLPHNKDVVIDSKVSLLAHEKAVNAQTQEARKAALKEHVLSVKGHIKGLSKKDYQDLTGVNTLDYVLMFLPIESAFASAINEDPEIMKLAMDKQIMLVSPTNLLVALRTIHNIWQYEYQNQHAMQIAEKAKKMYDKFVGFTADMQDIGKQLERVDKSYSNAMNKLSSGRGNLISQAESFKTMGVSPNKSLDKLLLDSADTNEKKED